MSTNNNLFFKRGSQANLNNITASIDGAFYLTTDTNRLYIGNGGVPALLNQTVQMVSSLEELKKVSNPNYNDFYYVISENILCVYVNKEGSDKWEQINPDHNDNIDTYVTSVEDYSVTSNNDGITVKFNIKQTEHDLTGSDEKPIADIPVEFLIKNSDLNTASGTNVGLATSVNAAGTQATVNTIGGGSDGSKSITLSAKDNIKLSSSGAGVIELSAVDTTYTFTVDTQNNNLIVMSGTDEVASIGIKGSNDIISVVADASATNKGFTISHKSYAGTKNSSEEPTKLSYGDTLEVLTGVSLEEGHISSYEATEIILPDAVVISDFSVDAAASVEDQPGKFTLTIKDTEQNEKSVDLYDDLYLTVNGSQIHNQGSIEFYTKDEIDDKFKTADAMEYRGTIGSKNGVIKALPTTNVKNGYTYKVVDEIDITATLKAYPGDLLIAEGEETDGYLTTINWNVVPAGSDIDTTYTLYSKDGGICLLSSTSDEQVIQLSGDSLINIATTDENKTIKIEHATQTLGTDGPPENASKLSPGETFLAINGLESDGHGHITKYSVQKLQLPQDKDTTYTLSAQDNTINLTAGTDVDSVVLAGEKDYIALATKDNTITISHEDAKNLSVDSKTETQLTAGSTFSPIVGVTRDTKGHITGYKTIKYTLPEDKDTTYTIDNSVDVTTANNNTTAIIETVLTAGTDEQTITTSLKSSTLALAGETGTTNININLTWGTF